MKKKTRTKTQQKIDKRISSQLHTELSEYASLLRAIRLSETDDLARELVRVGENKKRKNMEEEGEGEGEGIAHRVRKRPRRSTTTTAPEAREKPAEAKSKVLRRKRRCSQSDLYTLWPLFPEHCPTPEFQLEEEIVAIAEEWFRTERLSQTKSNNGAQTSSRTGDTDEPISLLPTAQIHPLLLSAFDFLSTLLTSLARHRRPVSFVKKGKAVPMRWVDVLEVAASMDSDKHHGLDHACVSISVSAFFF